MNTQQAVGTEGVVVWPENGTEYHDPPPFYSPFTKCGEEIMRWSWHMSRTPPDGRTLCGKCEELRDEH